MEPIPGPAVSVVIPTLQRRELIQRAVASVLRQSFQDFELIVVDSGSTDGTAEAMAAVGPRVRFLSSGAGGVSAARNAGLRLARAPVVAFLDSDNRWLPDHLATLTAALARHPEAILASTCPNRRVAGRQTADQSRLVDGWAQPFRSPGYISCWVVRREALDAVGGFNEGMLTGEDTDLWLRLASRGPFCFIQRRTIVKQYTRGGLMERGLRSGTYLDAEERRARAVLGEYERRGAPSDHPVLREARARLQLVIALRAVVRGDETAARVALAEACAIQPSLSRRPFTIARRLDYMPAHNRFDRLQNAEQLQSLWPTPASDTALYLRSRAAALALGAGRPTRAARLLLGCLRPTTPGFVVRMLSTSGPHLRQWIDQRLHRGRESSDLTSSPPSSPGITCGGP